MGYSQEVSAEVEIGREFDRPGEECGVFGLWLTEEGMHALHDDGISPRDLTYQALISQVNRGQQNTGLATSVDGKTIQVVTGHGSPDKAFDNGAKLTSLPEYARYWIGHNRYTTVGGELGAQPVHMTVNSGSHVAQVINGQFVNHRQLAHEWRHTDKPSDSWVHGAIIADEIDAGWTLPGALIDTTEIAKGAFSIVAFHNGEMVGMRDPHGMRPLVLGELRDYGWVLASETPTLEAVGADFMRRVKPGELVTFSDKGLNSIRYAEVKPAFCALEGIYLSRPEHGQTRGKRYLSGKILAAEAPVHRSEDTIVVPILGSAAAGAAGYADTLDIPLVDAVKKTKEDRAFMASGDRQAVVAGKLAIDLDAIRNKTVVLVDDSMVRGDTCEVVAQQVAQVAAEVHVRILSPPVVDRCFHGVDLKTKEELIANRSTREDFRAKIGAASLEYLSLKGLRKAFGKNLCTGCFTGEYPTEVPVELQHTEKSATVATIH